MVEANYFYLIDISIVNSYILFKKNNNSSSITQKNLRLEIVRAIMKKYNKIKLKFF